MKPCTCRVSEDADTHYDWELKAIADESGNIVNREFYPRNDEVYHHVGMRFYLSAVGIASQALATFTDASSQHDERISELRSPNPSTPGQNVTVHGHDSRRRHAGTRLPEPVMSTEQASLGMRSRPAATYTIMACYNGTGGNDGTQDSASPQITQTVNSAVADTTTTASNASATFSASNQNVTLSATVSSTNTVNAGTVTFTVKNGAVTIGSPVLASVNSGSASETFVLPANTPAGTTRSRRPTAAPPTSTAAATHQDTDGRPG